MTDLDYGPALPPGFKKQVSAAKDVSDTSQRQISKGCDTDDEPPLPLTGKITKSLPHTEQGIDNCSKEIGPELPSVDSSKNKSDVIGPSLPPSFEKHGTEFESRETNIYGPVLPVGMKRGGETDLDNPNLKSSNKQLLAAFSSDDEEDDCIGPSPHMMAQKGETSAVSELEERSRRMKNKLTGKDSQQTTKRESWMTELPSKMGLNIGLSARTFKARSGPNDDDRSVWTDTPSDKEEKEKERAKKRKHGENNSQVESETNKTTLKEVEAYNKSERPTSLLEMHQEERKKTEKDEELPQKRKAFDRETDLQVNRFDNAQRKALVKKSQELGSRFKSGGSQFL